MKLKRNISEFQAKKDTPSAFKRRIDKISKHIGLMPEFVVQR